MGDKAPISDKADWSDANVRLFIDICKGEIDAGNRPMGNFTTTGWKNVISKFEEKTGLKLTKKQLRNKLDNMKKDFTSFMELKTLATGLGWDEANQTVVCPNEWWDDHLAKCNNPEKGIKCSHVKFRKHGPKHLEDLHILFDKFHVTGATASCPNDVSSNDSSDDEVAEVDKSSGSDVKLAALKKGKHGQRKRKESSTATEEKDDKSPFVRMYKNTCKRIENAAERISTSVEASSAPQGNHVPSIAEALKMVKECEVEEKTALMHTASLLIVKPEFRELLASMETNDGRRDFIEREHERELMRRI